MRSRLWLVPVFIIGLLLPCAVAGGQPADFVVDFDDETKIIGTLIETTPGRLTIIDPQFWDGNEWIPLEPCGEVGTLCMEPYVVDVDLIAIVGEIVPPAQTQGGGENLPVVPGDPNDPSSLGIEDFFSLLPEGTDGNYWSIKTAGTADVIASIDWWMQPVLLDPATHGGKQPFAGGGQQQSIDDPALRYVIKLTDKEILVIIVHPDGGLEMFVVSKQLGGYWSWSAIPFGGDDWPGPIDTHAFPWRMTVPPDDP